MSPAFGEETQHAVIHQWINNGPSVGSTAHTRTFNLPASGLGKNDQGACHYLFSFFFFVCPISFFALENFPFPSLSDSGSIINQSVSSPRAGVGR